MHQGFIASIDLQITPEETFNLISIFLRLLEEIWNFSQGGEVYLLLMVSPSFLKVASTNIEIFSRWDAARKDWFA